MRQRTVSFDFRLLDGYTDVGPLVVAKSDVRVAFNGAQVIGRTLTGLQLPPGTYDQLNPAKHRVQPRVIIDGGAPQPLGVFTFADPITEHRTSGDTLLPPCLDVLEAVDHAPGQTMGARSGQSVAEWLRVAFAGVPSVNYDVEDNGAVFGEPMGWAPNESRLTAINDVGRGYGYFPAHSDNEGTARMRIVVDPDTDGWPALDHEQLMLSTPEPKSGSNYLSAANRYIVIVNNPDMPLVGVYNLPAAAPHSEFERGYVRSYSVNVQGPYTQEQVDAAAGALSYVDANQLRSLEYETPLTGDELSWTTVRAFTENWLVHAWSATLKVGGTVAITARRPY